MHIHSVSKVLGLPVILLALGILYQSWNTNSQLSVYLVIPAALVVVLYVFHGPIDHWWLSRFPVPFDPRLRDWLDKYFEPYQKFNGDDKKKFEYRIMLYLNGRLFTSVGSEMRDVPEDIKLLVASHGVHMCLALDDYLIGDMDRIFLYKHPFPTADHPYLHNVETNIEDGVIILSLEQLSQSILYPENFYNTAYHAYAEAFIGVNNTIDFPDCNETWDQLEKVSGWSKGFLYQQIGLKQPDPLAVHITLFFSKSKKYKNIFPENYTKWSEIFKQEP